MSLSRSVVATTVVACVGASIGSSASAAIITLGGDFNGSFGNTNVLAINGQSTNTLSGSLQDVTFAGVVNAASFDDGCNLLLTFTQFSFTSTRNTPVTLSVTIIQDYDVPVNSIAWTGSHQFNGDVTFSNAGQMASLNVVSRHETTNLPELQQVENAGGPGTITLNRGQGPTTVVNPFDAVYRIETTYTMVLAAGATGSVTLNLPDSGVDQASCVVPAPAAGLSLLGLAGIAGLGRRRR